MNHPKLRGLVVFLIQEFEKVHYPPLDDDQVADMVDLILHYLEEECGFDPDITETQLKAYTRASVGNCYLLLRYGLRANRITIHQPE